MRRPAVALATALVSLAGGCSDHGPAAAVDAGDDAPIDAAVDAPVDAGPSCQPRVPPAAIHAEVLAAFDARQAALEALVDPAAPAGFTTTRLYNLQLETASALHYATAFGDVALVERLARLYDRAWAFLHSESLYTFFYLCSGQTCPRQTDVAIAPARMWTNPPLAGSTARYESILDSAQFVYPLARIIELTAALPAARRTPALTAFVGRWLPVVLDDHYARWVLGRPGEPGVYQRAGWCSAYGNFTLVQHVDNLIGRRYGTAAFPGSRWNSYCNAVTDDELWVIAGVAELLMAHQHDPVLAPIPDETRDRLTTFLRTAVALVAARTSTTVVRDDHGAPLAGRVFDQGAYDDHPDHAYAGDTGATFPGWLVAGDPPARPPTPAHGTGWDVSHGRRLVAALDSLRRATFVLDTPWPTRDDLVGYARQLAWGVARDVPGTGTRFTNLLDGTNGWYRVNYSGRPNFGYAPYGLSDQVAPSGYGAWGAYEPAALAAIERYLASATPPATQRLLVAAGRVGLDSELDGCPPGTRLAP